MRLRGHQTAKQQSRQCDVATPASTSSITSNMPSHKHCKDRRCAGSNANVLTRPAERMHCHSGRAEIGRQTLLSTDTVRCCGPHGLQTQCKHLWTAPAVGRAGASRECCSSAHPARAGWRFPKDVAVLQKCTLDHQHCDKHTHTIRHCTTGHKPALMAAQPMSASVSHSVQCLNLGYGQKAHLRLCKSKFSARAEPHGSQCSRCGQDSLLCLLHCI